MPSTTPFSLAYRLVGWSLSTSTIEHGAWKTRLTLLLWKPPRVCTTTFEFELEPRSETAAFLELVLTSAVRGELPSLRLLSTLRALCTGGHAISRSEKSPRIGYTRTLRPSSLDTAKQISGLSLSPAAGSRKRSRKPRKKAGATTP